MKKALKVVFSVVLAACLAVSFAACDTGTPSESGKKTYEVTVVDGLIKNTTWNHDDVEEGSSVTVVPLTDRGTFQNWTLGSETITESEYTFTVNADTTITAHYEAKGETPAEEETVEITVVDGMIKNSNNWNHDTVKKGSSVTVSPLGENAARGAFKNWTLGGQTFTDRDYTFTANEDTTITANYDAPTTAPVAKTYELTVINGLTSEGYNFAVVGEDEQVTVEANDPILSYESFDHWEIKGQEAARTESYTFKLTENTTITAVFGTVCDEWDGEYPSIAPEGFIEDTDAKTWHIKSAAALAWWGKLVNCNADTTDNTGYKYTTFNFGIQAAYHDTQLAMVPKNAWTLSLEANLDMGGYDWDAITVWTWTLCGFTFEGNGHIIKNFYDVAAKNPSGNNGGGFFSGVASDNMTFRNVTFENAQVVASDSVEGSAAQDNLGIFIGYLNPNNHYEYFKAPQKVIFENVNINNSVVGSAGAYKLGFYVGRACQWAADNDYLDISFIGCNLTNSTMIGQKIFGGFVGYAANAYDSDPTPAPSRADHGNQLTITALGCTQKNITVITTCVSDENLYGYGSLCAGDAENGGWGKIKYLAQMPGAEYNLIDLHTGFGAWTAFALCTNAAQLRVSLEAKNEDEVTPTRSEILVARDIDMSDVADMLDWEANSNQYIYLVNGAQVTGIDLGNYVRYISGARDEENNLIVTDKDGSRIGIWTTSGAFQAD